MRIAQVLPALEFEARKDAAQMVGAVLRLDNGGDCPGTQYLLSHPQLLTVLFEGCVSCTTLSALKHTCVFAVSLLTASKVVARCLRVASASCCEEPARQLVHRNSTVMP